jgi:hypothetical protein
MVCNEKGDIVIKKLHLKTILESRGNLYVIEHDNFLNNKFYYVVNQLREIRALKSLFSLIIIRGEVCVYGEKLLKGLFLSGLSINKIQKFSADFIGILMTEEKALLPNILGINYPVKRIFFVDDMPIGSIRGQHSHSVETEFLYAIEGDFEVIIKGIGEFEGVISKGESALSLPNAWTSVKSLTSDGILLAFLSHKYDASGFSS